MELDAKAIAAATGGQVLREGPSGPVLTDTRKFSNGGWFLAIVGERFDGHKFLADARKGGASGCIVSEDPGGSWEGGVVLVQDTTVALQDLGRAIRAGIDVPVVALTGSSGKTTTRAFIGLAIEQLGLVHQTAGNLNNHLGLPMTLLASPPSADALVLELGTSSPGEIAFLDEVARPNVRLIVNVGPAHLEELGGLEGVAAEKGALFAGARPGDSVIINWDDPYIRALPIPDGARCISWGHGDEVDIQIMGCTLDVNQFQTLATLRTPQGTFELCLPVLGEHMVQNAAGAVAVAYALGLDLARSVEALGRYEPVGMRMRVEMLPGGVKALNDAYNANPASMKASLKALAAMPGRRVAVLGDMLELGSLEDEYHAEVARFSDSLRLDLIVLVGPRMAAASVEVEGNCMHFKQPADAVNKLRGWLGMDDVVLFKGSRGARVEQILHSLAEDTDVTTGGC